MQVRILTNNLDTVLVGADRAVCTEAKEQRSRCIGVFDMERRIVVETGMRDIVVDANGEVILWLVLLQFRLHGLDHGRRELLG